MIALLFAACFIIFMRSWVHWYQPYRLDRQTDKSFDKEYSTSALWFKHGMSFLIVVVMAGGWYLDGIERSSLYINEWAGLLCVMAGVFMRYWAINSLGRHFTFELGIREQHSLITAGPYQWIMHPSYTGTLLVESGMAFFFGQWIIGMLLVVSVVAFLYRRIRDEEKVLLQHFGEAFEHYKKTRYRLIPGIF